MHSFQVNLNTNSCSNIDNDATATSSSEMNSYQTKSDAEDEDYVPTDEESSDGENVIGNIEHRTNEGETTVEQETE